MAGRDVDTPWGPMAGCPDCGIIAAFGAGPHICEHGVTPAQTFKRTFTAEIDADAARAFLRGLYGDAPD